MVEEEVFENERYVPLLGWSSHNLLPTERKRFSKRSGGSSSHEFPTIVLPPDWEWAGAWHVETTGKQQIKLHWVPSIAAVQMV